MGRPTPDNPLGLDPRPEHSVDSVLGKLIDERIREAWRARAHTDLDGVPDAMLCFELMSRGWVVYKPRVI